MVAAAVMAFSVNALAQPLTAFPEGAEAITPEVLREALSGKVFAIKPANGQPWRWRFDANGDFLLNIASYSNAGKWSTKESSVCQDSGKNPGCNEMKKKDNVLYLKRDSGEVVTFQPQ
ncbi:hypothetical protein [Ottowia thiooxydans]|uniref:hypothetical protein n=1 Tax=Ottowia thiooxydans TaxID=219182 RepID=UPI000418FA58|nr:hypothetical protein [Ottowia thiooxydans]